MFRRRSRLPRPLDEILTEAILRPLEERLFLVEHLLRSLDPQRWQRALSDALYRAPEAAQRALWEALSQWLGAAVPARERYGEDAPRARLSSAERDRRLLAIRSESRQDPASVVYARKQLRWIRARLAALWPGFEEGLADGPALLEIGPGEYAGVAALLAASGARVTAVDALELLRTGDSRYYRDLVALMDEGGPFDWAAAFRLTDDRVELGDRLRYLAPVADGTVPGAEHAYAAAYSVAALEHVRDLGALCRDLARVLAPGAPTLHLLDLSDHRAVAAHGPLSHLCLDEEAWARVDADAGYYQSRRLAAEYQAAFVAAGFVDVTLEVLGRADLDAALRARLAEPFRSQPDDALTPIDVVLTARAPG